MRYQRLGTEPLQPGVANPATNTAMPGDWISRYTACWQLLSAIEQRYPHVLVDLEQYLVTFPASADGDRDVRIDWLRAWARRHRLVSDLVLKAAAKTVQIWRSDPVARNEHRWTFPDVEYRRPPLAVEMPEFPELVTRQEWVGLYDARIAQLKALGWTRTLLRDPEQADRLADLLLAPPPNNTYSAIAKAASTSTNISVAALHKSLTEFAALCELRELPPPAKGGRPRKPSTSAKRRIKR